MRVEPLRKSYSGPVTYNTNFHQRYCHLASKKRKISKKNSYDRSKGNVEVGRPTNETGKQQGSLVAEDFRKKK